MKKKLVLIASMIAASCLSVNINEAQAQSWNNYNRGYSNRGLNTRVYSYPANRGVVYSNRFYAVPMQTPNSIYSSRGYRNYGGYGNPGRYGYGNNFSNQFGYGSPRGYGNPSGYGYRGGYGYGNNFNNYGYGPNTGNRYSRGMSGYGTYRRYSY